MQLLDLYQSRFGAAVKRQGGAWNGPCPLCGGEPGKSDRFMVWPERAENLGETCASHNITGIWLCRRCGASGDTIAYLMQVDGLDFKGALGELGIESVRTTQRRRRAPAEPRRTDLAPAWTPREWPEPSDLWSTYAGKLLTEAEERIMKEPAALNWLAGRGITLEAVRHYRIGYLPAEGTKYPGRWRYRSALGLEPKQAADGTVKPKIFIPRGIVIPTFAPPAQGGKLLNLRIRRHKEDLHPLPGGKKPSKYMELEGSCKTPLFLRSSRPGPLAVYFVTEAELDAMLIHHATGGVIGALAVRTNRGKPDTQAHGRLRDAVRVCVALDYDDPGADGVDFWERAYPTALRWPTPEGKDPGDAFRLGVDIRAWVAAALPSSVSLPSDACCQDGAERHLHGQADTLPSGLVKVGGGAAPKTGLPESGSGPAGLSEQMRTSGDAAPMPYAGAFSSEEIARIEGALPAYLTLADVPVDVCRAWLLWQDVPASFTKMRDANGNSVGFDWRCNPTWKCTHAAVFDAFWRFQDSSRALWDWMSEHVEMKITARNLLRIWG